MDAQLALRDPISLILNLEGGFFNAILEFLIVVPTEKELTVKVVGPHVGLSSTPIASVRHLKRDIFNFQ